MSYALLPQRTTEQSVDIPVRRRRGGGGGFQGSFQGQNSTTVAEQIVDIRAGGGLQGLSGQGSASSSHSPAGPADEAIQGVVRTFSPQKKCGVLRKFECEPVAAHGRRRLMSSTRTGLGRRTKSRS